MATKITLVTGESIQPRHEIDEAVSEIDAALAAGSLMGVKSARGREFWINPAQIVRVEQVSPQ
jgi:uncharacterized protein YlzI (FlbEa/FlbD family)